MRTKNIFLRYLTFGLLGLCSMGASAARVCQGYLALSGDAIYHAEVTKEGTRTIFTLGYVHGVDVIESVQYACDTVPGICLPFTEGAMLHFPKCLKLEATYFRNFYRDSRCSQGYDQPWIGNIVCKDEEI